MPMDKKRVCRMRIGRQWEGAICASLLWMVLFVCADCDQQPKSGSQQQSSEPTWDAAAQRQVDEYDRQLATTQRHIEETERQLAESDRNLREIMAQNKRFEELLQRWGNQADRVDRLLERWERVTDGVEQRSTGAP